MDTTFCVDHPVFFGAEAEREMKACWRSLSILIFSGSLLHGADLSQYRGFVLGSDIATVGGHAGVEAAGARVIHKRPAMIEELEWQPNRVYSSPPQQDAVRDGLLTFLDGKLVRIVVTYDRTAIQGMTVEDIVSGVSAVYGPAVSPDVEIRFHSNYGESARVLSRWENDEFSYDLVRTGDHLSFALVLYAKEQDALAQAAIIEAQRLDVVEAPQRAAEREARRIQEERQALEKARAVNKPAFQP